MIKPESWSAIAAFITLAFTLVSSIGLGCYLFGAFHTRVTGLEERQKESESEARAARIEAARASADMVGLTATVAALKDSVNTRLDEVMIALRDLRFPPARRRRDQSDDA